jgi:predicted HTH transcriptional regulator
MEIDQRRIDELIAHPSESLNVEIKRWIDPATPEGTAKIVKAAQAIRNRNGGFLILGFDDKTLQPDVGNAQPIPELFFISM